MRQYGQHKDPIVRQQLAWAYTHVEIMRFAGLRTLSDVVAKKEPGPGRVDQQDVLVGVLAAIRRDDHEPPRRRRHGDRRRPRADYEPDQWQTDFLGSRSGTIWGGTAQVQRNIVGERVLGLPKEPDLEAQKG